MNKKRKMIADPISLLVGVLLLAGAELVYSTWPGLVAVALGVSIVGIILIVRGFTPKK